MIPIVSSLQGMRGHMGHMFELRHLKVRCWRSRNRRRSLRRSWQRVQSANMGSGLQFTVYVPSYSILCINELRGLFTMY